jgi:hypothetical protein
MYQTAVRVAAKHAVEAATTGEVPVQVAGALAEAVQTQAEFAGVSDAHAAELLHTSLQTAVASAAVSDDTASLITSRVLSAVLLHALAIVQADDDASAARAAQATQAARFAHHAAAQVAQQHAPQ